MTDEPLFSSILKGEDGEMVEGLTLIEKAIQLAVHAHVTQKDKAGAPYILHPLRLMMKMDTENEQITAVLHDIVEDTPYSIDILKKSGFPDECLKAIDCLSRKENESYEEFIERVKDNPLAKKVKMADLEDNMDMSRINDITEKDKKRLAKYQKAYNVLLMN